MKNRIVFLAILVLFIASLVFIGRVQAQSSASPQLSASSVPQLDKPIQVEQTPVASFWGLILKTIQDWFQKIVAIIKIIFTGISGVLPSPWNIVLVAIILLLLFRWFGLLISILKYWYWEARGKFGPIRVEEIVDKPGMSVLMRQYLTQCGAKCSSAAEPNASPGFETITAALAASDIKEAKSIVFILSIIDYLFPIMRKKTGYTVSCILTGDESKKLVNIYIEIKLTDKGKIKSSKSLDGVSYQEIVKKGAYWVFWYISQQKSTLRKIPSWYRFPTYDCYLEYNRAIDARDQDFHQDNKFYQNAAKEAPFNALVLLEWGDLNELNNQYLVALEIYVKAALMWPHLYVFWYRIAAILSYPDEWLDLQWEILGSEKKDDLIGLITKLYKDNKMLPPKDFINKLFNDNTLTPPTNVFKEDVFYNLSITIWKHLETKIKSMFITWGNQVFDEIIALIVNKIKIEKNRGTNLHPGFTPNLARYYCKLIPLFAWGGGRQFLRSVQLATACTIVQKTKFNNPEVKVKKLKNEIKKVNKIVERLWNTMDVYYNAACFYAQLSNINREYISIALDYLRIAFKDTRTPLDMDWVRTDPDFKHLRKDPEYLALFVTHNEKEISNDSEEENERKAKLDVLDLLQKGAQQQKKDWETTTDRSLSPEALLIEAEYQINLWDSLNKLLDTPDKQLQRELFWQLVMQNAKASDIPTTKKDYPKTSLDDINKTWKNITNHATPQSNTWKNRLEDCKLFLPKDGSPNPHGILNIWKQSETWQWFYLSQQIEVINPSISVN